MKARLIRPGFFDNEQLAECPLETRLLFVGLWMLADREGKLKDEPNRIRVKIFPYERFEVDKMLGELETKGFIRRYSVGGIKCLLIENFTKYQSVHKNEASLNLPHPANYTATKPKEIEAQVFKSASERRAEREAEVFRTAAINDKKRELKKLEIEQ